MLRSVLVAALMLAAASVSAVAQEDTIRPQPQAEDDALNPEVRSDGFVMMSDACGASRYEHLIGRDYAEVTEASLLPADSVTQNRNALRTLEYTPHKLNVAVGSDGRIIAIGCF